MGWFACLSKEPFYCLPRCKRAFCFAKPRLPPAGVCLPAASGHFTSQNRACLRLGPVCPPHAGILLRKTAPASGWGLSARRKRAFCFAKPRLPPAGVCLPAASGHFASQNRACLRQGSACPLHAGILLRKTAEPLVFKMDAAVPANYPSAGMSPCPPSAFEQRLFISFAPCPAIPAEGCPWPIRHAMRRAGNTPRGGGLPHGSQRFYMPQWRAH